MLPLPPFQLHTPRTLVEAVDLLAQLGTEARLIAGGTDLLPNMKHGLVEPRHLVSLRHVEGLRAIRDAGHELVIGATASLEQIAANPLVRERATALAEAAGAVGGPHHRRMGTLGGNLCLDTRCRFYNQSAFWREALGYCLKKDGTACHVVTSGKRCVATASNDTAPAAIVLGASLALVGPRGARTVLASEFYTADGAANTLLGHDEIVTALHVPSHPGRRSRHTKLRRRAAIDYPLLSIAACVDVDDDDRVTSLSLVVSALASRPRVLASANTLAVGRNCVDVPVSEIAEAARRECHPLQTLDADVAWRREMIVVQIQRMLGGLGLGVPTA